MQSLAGRVAIVTHAASELGRGICQMLGRAGARLALGDPGPGAAARLAAELRTQGLVAHGWPTGLTDLDSLTAVVHHAVTTYGRLDIMVNLSIVTPGGPAETMPFDQFRQGVTANLTATVFGSQAAAQQMIAQGALAGAPYKGCIINVTSVAGELAVPGHAAFNAAIAGIQAITKVLATEWRPHGVRVVAIATGPTPALVEGALRLPGVMRRLPKHELADGETVGEAVVFLASDAARHINGSTVAVDGGWLADGYWE